MRNGESTREKRLSTYVCMYVCMDVTVYVQSAPTTSPLSWLSISTYLKMRGGTSTHSLY